MVDFKSNSFYDGHNLQLESNAQQTQNRTAYGNRTRSPGMNGNMTNITLDKTVKTEQIPDARTTVAISFMNKR